MVEVLNWQKKEQMYYVFDTNFYRTLAARRTVEEIKELLQRLREKEKKLGIKPMMCSIVAQELLSHLLDQGGGTNCTNACIALYLHVGDRKEFRMIPLPEVQIAKMVFDIDWKQRIQTQESIGIILSELAMTTSTSSIIDKYVTEINQIRNYVFGVENTLADSVEQLFKKYEPNFKLGDLPFGENKTLRKEFLDYIDSANFDLETIMALLFSITYVLQQQGYALPPIEVILPKLSQIYKFYAAALAFRKEYFKRFSQNRMDLRKHNNTNYIWDEYILSSLGNSIGSEQIGIVTSDRCMNETMLNFNPSLKIITTDEYSKEVGINDLVKN